ncbi:PLP-dependent aminotransferase family protein, partial [Pseudomonas aeruginosa]|nr:PLP-dependent aminotransferase family protein [Pseudomonas aeruginosa]
HYPTGVTLLLQRRLALIEWAQRQQAWIIEDDHDSQFHHPGRPTARELGLEAHQWDLHLPTISKLLLPGTRIG